MSDEFVTKDMCNASRTSCEKLRTMENQNILLTLRAEIRKEIDEFKLHIDKKIVDALKSIGFSEIEEAENTERNDDEEYRPERHRKDREKSLHLVAWVHKNATWLLVTILALAAGKTFSPYVDRILEAITKIIEGFAK